MSKLLPFNLFMRQAGLYPLTSPFLPPISKVQLDYSYAAGRLIGTLVAGLPAALLKTGQVTSYKTGDDGDLELGVAKAYIDNANGTVTDTKTGLMWELKTNVGDIHDWDNTYKWTDGGTNPVFDTFIAGLNAANFAGHNDWRLPNALELFSLLVWSAVGAAPFITQAYFGALAGPTYYTKSAYYWSSTTSPSAITSATAVSFANGNTTTNAKTTLYAARAVRTA